MDKEISYVQIALMIAALGYFILPTDILPDAIPGVGFIDDGAVLTYFFKQLRTFFSQTTISRAFAKVRAFGIDIDEEQLKGSLVQAKKSGNLNAKSLAVIGLQSTNFSGALDKVRSIGVDINEEQLKGSLVQGIQSGNLDAMSLGAIAYESTTVDVGKLARSGTEYLISATSKSTEKKISRIRVEVGFTEHAYTAFDSDYNEVSEMIAFFNDENGFSKGRVYVDGEENKDHWLALEDQTEKSKYQTLDLAQKWEEEIDDPSDYLKLGYYDNEATIVWEFDVEDFDINKLCFYYTCFDVELRPASYSAEEAYLSLRYDGKQINPCGYDCVDGEFTQVWDRNRR